MKIGRNKQCPCKSGKKYKHCCARTEIPALDPKNIAGLSVSPKEGTAFYITKDILLNTLRRDGPIAANRFDQLHENDLRELSELLATTCFLLAEGLKEASNANDDLRIACGSLCQNAISTFTGATSLLRDGYYLQSSILVRTILETMATVMHLIMTPTDLARFKSNKLDLKVVIQSAKIIVPPFGQMYGMFSETFVHVGSLHSKPQYVGPHQDDAEARIANMSFLRFAIWLIFVTVELLFVGIIENGKYWEKIAPDKVQWRPNEMTLQWQDKFLRANPPKEAPRKEEAAPETVS